MNLEQLLKLSSLDVPELAQFIRFGEPLPDFPRNWTSLSTALLGAVRTHGDRRYNIDSNGESASVRDICTKAVGLARIIQEQVKDEDAIGIMLPPGGATAVAVVAGVLLGKVVVPLNYSTGIKLVNMNVEDTGLKTVISAKPLLGLMTRNGTVPLNVEKTLFIEELATQVTDDVRAWVRDTLTAEPSVMAARLPGVRRTLDDLAVIIFTSGSSGRPKGVELTHRAVLSNVLAVRKHYQLVEGDVILAVMPPGHALGWLGGIWVPLLEGITAATHANALDIKKVVAFIESAKVTLILLSPTVMRLYLKHSSQAHYSSVRILALGSEKVSKKLAGDIRDTLGLEVCEVYGLTEFGPCVALNRPQEVEFHGRTIAGNKLGTVGQLVPGTAAVLVDSKTGELLPIAEQRKGVLWVTGPQRMRGYLNLPEKTGEVLRGDWLCTKDIATIDEENFVTLHSKESREAKIGGEKVPMDEVQQAIVAAAGVDELSVHVTCVPAEVGEKLIVFHTVPLDAQAICAKLRETLINLFIPDHRNFVKLEEGGMPVGPTGKVDAMALKTRAVEEFGFKD